MAVSINELQAWLRRIEKRGAKTVWVDEGGLCLCADNDAYCEVGGEPEDAADDTDPGAAFDAEEEDVFDEK